MNALQHARACFLGVALFLSFTPLGLQSQVPADTAGQAQVEPSLGELRDRVEERYQVLPLQNGIVLMPKYGETAVQSIEMVDGGIAINGQPVTGAELQDRIGEDAADIRRLSFMDAGSRRVLFGIGVPPVADTVEADTARIAADQADPDDSDIDRHRGEGIDLGAQGDQVRIGGSIHVRADEVVDGDVVAVGGSVDVDGRVHGDVVAVGGSVELGPDAVVDGEVTSVGGTIERAPGARITGAVNEVAFGAPRFHFQPHFAMGPFFTGIGGLIGTVIWIIFLGLLACLAYLLARRPIERMEYRVATSPWKAAAVGLAAQILFFPALFITIVILAISIIGIPLLLLIPFALVALLLGILLGFTAVAKHLGHAAERRFGWDHRNPYVSLLVGLGLIMLVSFFGSALDVGGGPLGVFATILTILGFLIQYVAWTVGFGVFLLTRFGTRYRWGNGHTPIEPPAVGAPPAAPPPVPETTPEPAR
ncbi:MAG TPA: hypothetical protein VM737_03020 [Gemmatimonadota bacterium]|nr:hypothetical protein [Gemmatimonadota bacterium]